MSRIVDMCMWLIPSHHRTCGAEDRCRYALLTCRGGSGVTCLLHLFGAVYFEDAV